LFRRRVAVPLWILILSFITVIVISGATGLKLGKRSSVPFFTVTAASPGEPAVPFNGTFAPIAKKVVPSVVNISSSRVIRTQELYPFMDDPLFRRFFGPIPRELRERSLGSGVVVSPDGYVLTNNHVVEGANDIEVSFGDESQIPARIIGTDARTDVAVVKLDRNGLTPMILADSSAVEVGDVVLAVGNPFGIGRTVTMGIVSATSRGNLGIETEEDFIQTDAAINPGNSGGALVNTRGELIGISTAILSPTGGNLGIGFAVPSNKARFVMEQIAKSGKVRRGYLGVTIQNLTPELAKRLGITNDHGALIRDVESGSPAERAGLRPGNVVVEINGKPVTDGRDLQRALSEASPGSAVTLTIIRDGRQNHISVTLGEEQERKD
jgi:Do/DeqQ family serine protease